MTNPGRPAASPSSVRASGHSATRPVGRPRPRGQAFVELALVFPVLLLLTIGIVDMARIFSSYIAIIDGVREAALFAAEGKDNNLKWCDPAAPDDPIPCPTGWTAANESSDPDNIAFQIKSVGIIAAQVVMAAPVCDPDPCASGSTVTIAAMYQVPLVTPVLGNIFGGSVDVSVSTTAKVLE